MQHTKIVLQLRLSMMPHKKLRFDIKVLIVMFIGSHISYHIATEFNLNIAATRLAANICRLRSLKGYYPENGLTHSKTRLRTT